MASLAYRKNYKRKWISACRSLTKYDNSSKRVGVDETQNPPVALSPSCEEDAFDFEQFPTGSDTTHFPNLNIPTCDDADCNSNSDNERCCLSDSESEEISLEDGLVDWVNHFQVKHNAVDSLLKLLKQSGHPCLPATARSLLGTAREFNLQKKSGMEYLYFPLGESLLENFRSYPQDIRQNVDHLELNFNIDGIPLFKSSRSSLWPVLCGIMNVTPVKVFPIALSYGKTKPSDLDFLHDTVQDLNNLMKYGLKDGDKVLSVSVRCFVCDAPARSLVKCTKLYSGYYGCDKCCQSGVWIGRMTFPDTDGIELRTDESFRRQSNREHHHGTSPLCDLDVDMIKAFPHDYMHLACLGVMKKLILAWMRGKRDVRISARQIDEISTKLVNLKKCIPSSFARKPRGLAEVDRWKATEYRQFLLYTGKIVLKGILRDELFEHFLTLSIAISILVCPELAQTHLNYASELLKYFVAKASELYGEEFIVYNVHSLLHMTEDVAVHGSLDRFSAFPFENYLQRLKRCVRSGKNPIVQIAKRLSELPSTCPRVYGACNILLTKKPNNCYILNNNTSCCEVVHKTAEVDDSGKAIYSCRVFEHSEPMFVSPCDSRIIGVHKVRGRNAHMKLLPESALTRKAIFIELENDYCVFLAILHEL